MKVITIIVHVYAEKHPIFASMMTAQLSSLVTYRPDNVIVNYAVALCATDVLTNEAIDAFLPKMPSNVVLTPVEFPKEMLFRRAIARNCMARDMESDIFWFADCDYLFGPSCLDVLGATDIETLVFPQEVMIHRSHREGDAELARIVPGKMFWPNLALFERHRVKMAIGGLQIVPSEIGRQGYLDGTRWVKPISADRGFQDTREDRIYRGAVGPGKAIDLPNLFRLRHSESAFESAELRLAQTDK